MRAYVPEYEIYSPKSLADALAKLESERGVWRPFAGGTDLMVLFEAGKLAHKRFLSLWHLDDLRGISASDDCVVIGGLTTYTQIQGNDILQKEFPMLCKAASETGAVAIQNRGTIGGNIVNASPAADSPPALLTYDAEVELVSAKGSRWVKYDAFHTGYKTTVMQPHELLRAVRLPRTTSGAKHYYRKVGTRKAQAISKVCFAGLVRPKGGQIADVRIALGSVAPTVFRPKNTEAALIGQSISAATIAGARQALAAELAPIDDIRSTKEYRLNVSLNLLEEFLRNVELDQQA